MGEVNQIIQLFRERTSKELPVSSSLSPFQEEELANQLFDVFQSIWTSTSYNQEDETTLDHNKSDNETDECKDEPDNASDDPDYDEKDEEKPVFEPFSLSYMKRALAYYDAINPETGKRSYTWKSVVTKRELIDETEIKRSAEQFVTQVESLVPHYNEDFVLNTDQSGFQLEFPSTPTLSHRGEKTTLATVRSRNATTHSYTVTPTI
ncbi:unnamed protein product, partial [Rotaria sp. Silwood2]